MPANIAIDYFPTAFSSQGPKLMGLNAANEGFLRAFARHAQVEVFAGHTRTGAEFESFASLVRAERGKAVPVARVLPGQNAALARAGALLHPFPGFGPLAWHRRHGRSSAYSLLGITHTTATHAVMDSIGNLMVAPIEPWDAVVCTSHVVRATYETVLTHWESYLAGRLGAKRFPRPQLPVIPLGVDCDRYAPADAESTRAAMRAELGLEDGDLVVFWMGRFTHLAKAHPVPSYLALQALAKKLQRRVVHLQAGWFASDELRRAYADAAARFSPDVRHVFVDGREPRIREGAWAAADIFLSLSDNLQESFGLTPIEAMAAGLPVVVSDWDGYKDTVRDGIDGFRIPTRMPPPGTGLDLAFQFSAGYMDYGAYCGTAAQMTSVDLPRCVEALATLAQDEALRRRMADAGRQRAREAFDWREVVRQYQELGEDLAARRAAGVVRDGGVPAVPFALRDDPFRVFAGYPTTLLDGATRLWPGPVPADVLGALHEHPLNGVGSKWRAPEPALRELLDAVGGRPGLELGMLVGTAGIEPLVMLRSVAWLLKVGLLSAQPIEVGLSAPPSSGA